MSEEAVSSAGASDAGATDVPAPVPPAPPLVGGRYAAMEGLRAYAALLIFCVHFAAYFSALFLKVDLNDVTLGELSRYEKYVTWMYWLFRSHYGVDLFFLLSGFLMTRLVRRPDFHYGNFLGHRIARIYPAYVVCFFLFLAWWQWGRGDARLDSFTVIGNLLLLNSFPQVDVRTLYTVNWSLGFEFVFYILFPLVLMLKGGFGRLTRLHLVFAGVVTYVAAFYLGDLYIRFLMFFGGVLLASYNDEELRGLARQLPDWLVLIVYLGATFLFLQLHQFRSFTPVFLPAATLLVLNTIFGTGFLNWIFSRPWLRFIGNVSFSFYLVHATVIDIVFFLYRQTSMEYRRDDCLIVGAIVCLGVSLLAATLIYYLVERRYFTARQPKAATKPALA